MCNYIMLRLVCEYLYVLHFSSVYVVCSKIRTLVDFLIRRKLQRIKCKCQIFTEFILHFVGITIITNTEHKAKFSVTTFVQVSWQSTALKIRGSHVQDPSGVPIREFVSGINMAAVPLSFEP